VQLHSENLIHRCTLQKNCNYCDDWWQTKQFKLRNCVWRYFIVQSALFITETTLKSVVDYMQPTVGYIKKHLWLCLYLVLAVLTS